MRPSGSDERSNITAAVATPTPATPLDVRVRLMGDATTCLALIEDLRQVAEVGHVEGPIPNRRGSGVRFYLDHIRPRQ